MSKQHEFDRTEYAARLAIARSRKNLTQAELAFKIGWCTSAVSHHEAGRRTPSVANLWLLCDALKVSADWLLGRTPL
jgi:transcriptional regulator with XRE-family HTH domain